MTMPLISVVTISFNQRKFLQQTIDSVVEQKASDVEYIVVDGGSTDGSLELLADYKDNIDHVISGPDAGPADGLNKGFAIATGKVGYFLNSDDYLMPHGLEVLRQFWSRPQAVNALLCGAWMVDANRVPMRELQPTAINLQGLLNGAGTMVQQGLSFKLEAFRKCNGFNIQNRSCWDLELLCNLLQDGREVGRLNDRIGAFRLHAESFTGGVAGAKHQAKYRADFGRLQKEFNIETNRPASLLRHLTSPQNLLDRILPGHLIRRYAADCAVHGK